MGTFTAIPRPPRPISTSDSEKKEFQSTNLQTSPKPPSEPLKIQEKDQIPKNSVSSTKVPAPQTPYNNIQQTNNQPMTASLRGLETTPKPPRKSAQQPNSVSSTRVPAPQTPNNDIQHTNNQPMTKSLRGPETTPKPPRKPAPIPPMPLPPPPIIVGSPENDFSKTDFGIPLFFKKFVSYLWLFIIGILGFFIIAETSAFLRSFHQLCRFEQFSLGIPMVIFTGILFFLLGKIIFFFFHLRTSPNIEIKVLKELASRKSMRRNSRTVFSKAQEELVQYLNMNEDYDKTLKMLGMSDEILKAIKKQRENLKSNQNEKTKQSWLEDFSKYYQLPIDAFAKQRVKHYAAHAAWLATISPIPLLDRLIVGTACVNLIKELLQIYNLKPSWDKSLILMAKTIFNIYFSGISGDVATKFAELSPEVLEKSFDQIGLENFGDVGASILSKLKGPFSKLTEAGIHGLLVYRIGQNAIKMLRPVETSQ